MAALAWRCARSPLSLHCHLGAFAINKGRRAITPPLFPYIPLASIQAAASARSFAAFFCRV